MKRLLIDTTPIKYILKESESGGPLRLRGVFQKSDVLNANKRVYPRNIWEKTIKRPDIVESISKRRMVGEVDHPNESDPKLKHASHIITELVMHPDGIVEGELEILPTEYGKHLESLLRANVEVGVSSRGMGSTYNKDGVEYIGEDYELLTFDVVASPSTPGAYPKLVESRDITIEENTDMSAADKFRALKEAGNRLLSIDPKLTSKAERASFVAESESIVEQLDRVVQEDGGFKSLATDLTSRLQETARLFSSKDAPPSLEVQLEAAKLIIAEMSQQMSFRERKMLRTATKVVRGLGEKVNRVNVRNRKLVKENARLIRENRIAMSAGDELLHQFKMVQETKRIPVRFVRSKNRITESDTKKPVISDNTPSPTKRISLIEKLERKGNVVFRPGAVNNRSLTESRRDGSTEIASAMISAIGGI